jgi:hypothetical protein
MKGGNACWIPDPATLTTDGYSWGNVQTIDTWSMQQIPHGDPLPSVRVLTVDTGTQDVGGYGGGHWLHTTAYLTEATGVISGQTHIWATNIAFGFHGGVYALCADANGAPVGAVTPVYRWGVDADNPFFGNHDRTAQWPDPAPRRCSPQHKQTLSRRSTCSRSGTPTTSRPYSTTGSQPEEDRGTRPGRNPDRETLYNRRITQSRDGPPSRLTRTGHLPLPVRWQRPRRRPCTRQRQRAASRRA